MTQQIRKGTPREARRFDQTYLSARNHGRKVHRDYAAHFFRWGWVSRVVRKGMKILEVGCGRELPLVWTIAGDMAIAPPKLYVGTDLNVTQHTNIFWGKIYDQFNFVDRGQELARHGKFDMAVSLEVIEHMGKKDGLTMLKKIHALLKPGGLLYLSTPVFNGAAARNHIHEYTIPELQRHLEKAGFAVLRRFGTFASYNDIKKAMLRHHDGAALNTYDRLSEYYGGHVMSLFLAPLYPDDSRNNFWVCRKEKRP